MNRDQVARLHELEVKNTTTLAGDMHRGLSQKEFAEWSRLYMAFRTMSPADWLEVLDA